MSWDLSRVKVSFVDKQPQMRWTQTALGGDQTKHTIIGSSWRLLDKLGQDRAILTSEHELKIVLKSVFNLIFAASEYFLQY